MSGTVQLSFQLAIKWSLYYIMSHAYVTCILHSLICSMHMYFDLQETIVLEGHTHFTRDTVMPTLRSIAIAAVHPPVGLAKTFLRGTLSVRPRPPFNEGKAMPALTVVIAPDPVETVSLLLFVGLRVCKVTVYPMIHLPVLQRRVGVVGLCQLLTSKL